MSESTVQKYLIAEVKKLGGLAVKVECSSRRGWPDITMVLPNKPIFLVEVKSDTRKGRLSDHQKQVHTEIALLGDKVWIVESKTEVDQLLQHLQEQP